MPQDELDAAPVVVLGWVLLLIMIGLSVRKTPYAKGSRALLAATVVGAAAVALMVLVYLPFAPRAKFAAAVDASESALFIFYLALGYFALVSFVALLLWMPIIDHGQDRLVYAVVCGAMAAGLPLVFFGKDWLVTAGVVAIGGAIGGFVGWKVAHLPAKQSRPFLNDEDPALNMDAVKAAKTSWQKNHVQKKPEM